MCSQEIFTLAHNKNIYTVYQLINFKLNTSLCIMMYTLQIIDVKIKRLTLFKDPLQLLVTKELIIVFFVKSVEQT